MKTMSLRRSNKKKRSQNSKRKSLPSIAENRTRSRNVRNVASEMNLNKSNALSRRSSDSSIVYLGSYRKIPELINLEDSCDNYEGKPEARSPKLEEIQSGKTE